MDHMPINLQMSGSSDGNTRLNDRAPPASIDTYPCTSNTVYRAVPGTAGFFVAVDALGANVAAVFCTTCLRKKAGELKDETGEGVSD